MSSDDSDAGPQRKRKRNIPRIKDSPESTSSSGSPIIPGSCSSRMSTRRERLRANPLHSDSDASSDSGSPIIGQNHRKKVMRVESDSEEESSGSTFIRRSSGRPRRLSSDSGEGNSSSQWETDNENECEIGENCKGVSNTVVCESNNIAIDSDSSDGHSEKCPICLLSFRNQEIGTPEACDHVFCLECIQEWSKNMNTCPVDRQEYRLILVRSGVNGKVVRQIEIEKPVPQNVLEIEEDPTFCEICGNNDREDRMLLCDGCDLGFHMHCLDPPLSEVPEGLWYCTECSPFGIFQAEVDLDEVQMLLDDAETIERPTERRRRRSTRLIPRTIFSERVRRTIANNRHQNSGHHGDYSGESDDAQEADVLERVSSSTTRKSRKKTSKRRSVKSVRYKTVYVIDKVTGEAVPVKKRQKRNKRKQNRRIRRVDTRPKTVKKRLAKQLGICSPGTVPQNLPDVKIPSLPNTINGLRHQAGIPTLHLFGQNNELDYFSGSDDEYSPSSQLLARRAPTRSDVSILRRVARRKAAISLPSTVVSSSTDLLGSILNSQEEFLSRNATYSLDSSGKFKIQMKKSENNNGSYINLNSEKASSKETPNNYPNNRNNYNYNRYRYYPNSYNRRHSQSGNQNYNYNTAPSSSWQNQNSDYYNRYGGPDDNEYPQDYTQRTLCATSDPDNERDDRENEYEAAANSESEIDIYSDIETVTTSKVEDAEHRPLSPPPVFSHLPGTDDDNNDSEPDMVIDDEKLHEEHREESAVTSTVDNSHELPRNICAQTAEPYEVHKSFVLNPPNPVYSEALPSSSFTDTIGQYNDDDSTDGCPNTNIYNNQAYDVNNDNEDVDEDDEGCPNFSIYSKESKTVALHTELSLPSSSLCQDHQVEEISSSPLVAQKNSCGSNEAYDPAEPSSDEPVLNDADLYDPEAAVMEQSPAPSPTDTADKASLHNNSDTSNLQNEDADSVELHEYPGNISGSSETAGNESVCVSLEQQKEYDTPEETSNQADFDEENHQPSVKIEEFSRELSNEILPEQDFKPDSPASMDNQVVQQKTENEIQSPDMSVSQNERTDLDETGGSTPLVKVTVKSKVEVIKPQIKGGILGGLYSDSEDEAVVKLDNAGDGALGMTEDISEEERSYTPCLDEKKGLEGLDTELISDEDRNDFDESHEHKTGSDGDALEINAKELDLELRPEDYEEGEIVDKSKIIIQEENNEADPKPEPKKTKPKKDSKDSKKSKKKEKSDDDKNGNKENEKNEKEQSFKKISKSNKERNYRDKDNKSPSPSKSKEILEANKKEKKKEKRKELERYNVRAVIAEKPRPLVVKDQFGRDIRPTPSRSRSRSYTPPLQTPPPRRLSSCRNRSPSPVPRSRNRSPSADRHQSMPRSRSLHRSRSRQDSPIKERSRKRRRSRNLRSTSRSKSPNKKRSRSKNKKRKRSLGRREKRKSSERVKSKKKPRRRSRSRPRHRSFSPTRRHTDLEWNRREWSHTLSMSPSRQEMLMSPSWTPPRESNTTQVLRNSNLTVTLNNANKKKKERRKKDKRGKEAGTKRRQRFDRSERTPPPSKEVFASGDNILVSVSFNNENEVRDVTTREKRKVDNQKKKKKKRTKPTRDITGIKPVAIIDLARSPFRELTPSPRNVIVLSDSDADREIANNVEKNVCDSSQQVASPEHTITYSMGPKTPPEPQIKFSLAVKPPQIRAISNPLHEPEDIENNEDDVQQQLESRMNEMHKGPNTPPEPPNSPPSSPDAYDPFEPTKSRSPTPDPMQTLQSNTNLLSIDDQNENNIDSRSDMEKVMIPGLDSNKSLTPPLLDVQPADSQSSIQVSPESTMGKSPDRIGSVSQSLQNSSKPIAQTTPFSSVPTSIVNSIPSAANQAPSRINIINSTVIPAPIIASSIPQRIVLPNQVKSSPVKIPPTKTTVKSTPIKPMLNKSKLNIVSKRQPNGGNMDDVILDVDSPYSPGSSDYDDLFEPPSDIITKPVIKTKNKTQKQQTSTFDALFGSPTYKPSKISKTRYRKGTKTKMVGVKLDEDCLKILDELPNSAVEMQVKDKFLKKLNRQERVVEEVKLVLKPYYNKKRINKEEYKEIMRRAVPKICHNKSGEINPTKIKNLVEAYVKKIRHSKKVTSSSSVNNPVKV